ncbi:MAG TPA: hypothetical protein VJ346_02650 [Bacteroidales bacterium]|nr:hypothetical protein [Bacteroidales bacterium]
MRKISYLLLQTAFCMSTQAQVPDQGITEQDLQSFSEGKPMFTTNMEALYEGVKWTPYLNDEWQTGDVYFPDGTEIIQINIRYNVYKDELEFKNSTSGETFIINRDKINGFRIHEPEDSLYFEYFSLKPDKPEEKSFVQILYNGGTRLLLKHKKQFIKADYQGAYSTGNKYDEYLDDKDYYLVKDDGVYRKIKLNKKSVLSALEDSQAALKEYALKHMINFARPEDIIRLLVFYDSQRINR